MGSFASAQDDMHFERFFVILSEAKNPIALFEVSGSGMGSFANAQDDMLSILMHCVTEQPTREPRMIDTSVTHWLQAHAWIVAQVFLLDTSRISCYHADN